MSNHIIEIEKKMESDGLNKEVIQTFSQYYTQLREGHTGKLSNKDIEAPDRKNLVNYENLNEVGIELLDKLAVIKLNGGLGTSMGLDRAKSLLQVKGEMTFLDILSRQILALRSQYNSKTPLIFMNSYNTQKDTLDKLGEYSDLKVSGLELDFLQNKFPRIRRDNFAPLNLDDDNANWNPPGHGDIYGALNSSGLLDKLLESGIKYAFISNSDNLGAVVDTKILKYMADKETPFIMEVCKRTEMDKKGGHLAQTKDGNLILREVAQCPEDEIQDFQDIKKFSYFNTNNLWVNLETLKNRLDANNNVFELPLIINPKVVNDIPVYQIETAMGAAISVFEGAKALVVPRSRFAPVKKTNDLLIIWSDVYKLNSEYQIVLTEGVEKVPVVSLDTNHYKTVQQLKQHFKDIPSLIQCTSLTVTGNVVFGKNVFFKGDVVIETEEKERITDTIFDGDKSSLIG
jgi:UTP--glucose-1-phosphate uridylyltransferase